MPASYSRPKLDPATIDALAVDACRRAIEAGATSLSAAVLRRFGARSDEGAIRAARDKAIAAGVIVPPPGVVVRGPYRAKAGPTATAIMATQAPAPILPGARPEVPGARSIAEEIRAGRATAAKLAEYGAGLREDIEAAEAEYVERGELPASGYRYWLAVLHRTEARREAERRRRA